MIQTSTANSVLPEQAGNPPSLRSMPFGLSLLLFAIPAAVICLAFYFFRPWLETLGYSPLKSYLAALTVPTALLFAAALIAYHRVEGYPLTRSAFAARMRFPTLRPRDLLYALAILVVQFAGYGLFSQLGLALIHAGVIPLPADVPVINDPRAPLTAQAMIQYAGGQLRGQWDVALLGLVMFFFNIVGEELWWRGFILPRQELAHGKVTWLLHGVMWDLFHIFKWWDLIGLLPVCLSLSYAAQRLKTNWPGLIAHAIFNVSGLLFIVSIVAGWIR